MRGTAELCINANHAKVFLPFNLAIVFLEINPKDNNWSLLKGLSLFFIYL